MRLPTCRKALKGSCLSVSYTHLDVYKRQVYRNTKIKRLIYILSIPILSELIPVRFSLWKTPDRKGMASLPQTPSLPLQRLLTLSNPSCRLSAKKRCVACHSAKAKQRGLSTIPKGFSNALFEGGYTAPYRSSRGSGLGGNTGVAAAGVSRRGEAAQRFFHSTAHADA